MRFEFDRPIKAWVVVKDGGLLACWDKYPSLFETQKEAQVWAFSDKEVERVEVTIRRVKPKGKDAK